MDNPALKYHSRHTTAAIRQRFHSRDPRCYYCGRKTFLFLSETDDPGRMATLDHLTPRSRGGHNTHENMKLACKRCNGLKASMTEKEFRASFEFWKLIDVQRPRQEIKL